MHFNHLPVSPYTLAAGRRWCFEHIKGETSIYLLNCGHSRKASLEKAQALSSGSTRPGVQGGSRDGRDLLRFMNAKLGSVSVVTSKGLWEIPGFPNPFISIHIHNSYIFFLCYWHFSNKRNTLPCLPDLQNGEIPRQGVPCSYILIKPRPRHVFVKSVHLIMSLALLERNSGQSIGIIILRWFFFLELTVFTQNHQSCWQWPLSPPLKWSLKTHLSNFVSPNCTLHSPYTIFFPKRRVFPV